MRILLRPVAVPHLGSRSLDARQKSNPPASPVLVLVQLLDWKILSRISLSDMRLATAYAQHLAARTAAHKGIVPEIFMDGHGLWKQQVVALKVSAF